MILYHFPTSPFARRVRLALSLKGLSAELRDARAEPAHSAEVKRLNPLHTVPVLLDGERVICDSLAICQYLERKVPTPPLWPAAPAGASAFELSALADGAINILIDLALRYAPVQTDPHFPVVREALVGRAQRALNVLAEKVTTQGVTSGPLCGDAWGAADIAVFTTVAWLEGLPARAATFPLARNLVELGWSLPPRLSAWADQHRARADVLALG
ncbi:MAG: glutathione S-transferase family protein [Polyangiaceae bacterium]